MMTIHPTTWNDGIGPIHVPGFGDVPLTYPGVRYRDRGPDKGHASFADGAAGRFQLDPPLTAREVAMLRLVNDLTDRDGWQDQDGAEAEARWAAWRAEALARPVVSAAAWEWCRREVREHAAAQRKDGYVVIFDAGAGVCKADGLVPETLQARLCAQLEALLGPKSRPPGLTHQIDPSLHPLLWGRTRVLSAGGTVDLEHCIERCGQGKISPDHTTLQHIPHYRRTALGQQVLLSLGRWRTRFSLRAAPRCVSRTCQWLPCEVECQPDDSTAGSSGAAEAAAAGAGSRSSRVRITSYINNLHPVQQKELYRSIEEVLVLALGPFSDILIYNHTARYPRRILKWAVSWKPKATPDSTSGEGADDPGPETLDDGVSDCEDPEQRIVHHGPIVLAQSDISPQQHAAWRQTHSWEHPEPGSEPLSYEQWRHGRRATCIIRSLEGPHLLDPPSLDGSSLPPPGQGSYGVALEELAAKSGLQVIVRASSIDLHPSRQPRHYGTAWGLQGLVNDHIAASAVYCYSAANVTEPRMGFRGSVSLRDVFDRYGEADAAHLFGLGDVRRQYRQNCLQSLGSVVIRPGRLIVWPNVLESRMGKMQLQDPTRPGHLRFLTIHLVDPMVRICSTRNVPPQQAAWWTEEALKNVPFAEHQIPPEVVDLVRQNIHDWPMSEAEAEKGRQEVEQEHLGAHAWAV